MNHKDEIYNIKNDIVRRLFTALSVSALFFLYAIELICRTIANPDLGIKCHYAYVSEAYMNFILSMWFGVKPQSTRDIRNKHYK
jgi:hypothetical protein